MYELFPLVAWILENLSIVYTKIKRTAVSSSFNSVLGLLNPFGQLWSNLHRNKCPSTFQSLFYNFILILWNIYISNLFITHILITEIILLPWTTGKITWNCCDFSTIVYHKIVTPEPFWTCPVLFNPFLWIWESIGYYFLLSWKTSFSTAHSAGLLVLDFLKFLWSENVFTSSFIFEGWFY